MSKAIKVISKRKYWKPHKEIINYEMLFKRSSNRDVVVVYWLLFGLSFLSLDDHFEFQQIRNLDTFEMLKHIKSHLKHFFRLLITKIFCCFCWEILLVRHIKCFSFPFKLFFWFEKVFFVWHKDWFIDVKWLKLIR